MPGSATPTSSLSYIDLFLGTIFNPVSTVTALATGTTPDWQLTMIQNQAQQDIYNAGGSQADALDAVAATSAAFHQGNAAAAQNWADWWKRNLTVIEWVLGIAIVLYALGLGLRFKEDFFK